MPNTEDHIAALYGTTDKPAESTTPVNSSDAVKPLYETKPNFRPPAKTASEVVDQLYPHDDNDNDNDKQEEEPESEITPEIEELYSTRDETATGNPYAVEPGSAADELYGATEKVHLGDDLDLSIIYADEEDQKALYDNLGYMASVTGMGQEDVQAFVGTANELLMSGEESDPRQTLSDLYQQHGSNLHQQLADAQQLIQSLPDLAAWLEQTGLGNNKKIISHAMRIAANPRSQERLNQIRKKLK